jgi:hypothetical protein
MAKNKLAGMFKNISWQPLLGLCVIILAVIAIGYFVTYKPTSSDENLKLSAEIHQAYIEASQLASMYGNPDAAIKRLDLELADVPSNTKDANDLYSRAKLNIYKADLVLTYGPDFTQGFALLGEVYGSSENGNLARSEALSLAMAHAVQGLDEGLLTASEVRDHVLLDKNFNDAISIGLADAMLIKNPIDTYKYLANGFAVAMDMTPSEKVYTLSEAYSLRLTSSFVLPPPTGGYYASFIASVEDFEARLDQLVAEYKSSNVPYQEFVATSYYNIARAYEALPQGNTNIVMKMGQAYDKLSSYLAGYQDTAFGTQAYLLSINTRLICRAVDDANFDAANINKAQIQPHLNTLYASQGWVVPCKAAFEFIAKDIDTRFAEYF